MVDIAKKYPQALYYSFRVIESNVNVNVLDADADITSLYNKLQGYYGVFNNLNAWVQALDGLVYPEHRFKYWHQIISDMLESP